MPIHNSLDVIRIQDRLRDYVMEVKHTDGVYRHLYFYNPTDKFSPANCSFSVITWPGHAWIGGDWCDGHTITREHDMLTEFCNVSYVDYDYWAEKMRHAGHHQQIAAPTENAADSWIEERIQEIADEYTLTDEDRDTIRDHYRDYGCNDNATLDLEALQDSPLLENVALPSGETIDLTVDDAWEIDDTEYQYGFLVACEGLRHAAHAWAEYQKEKP